MFSENFQTCDLTLIKVFETLLPPSAKYVKALVELKLSYGKVIIFKMVRI
jgi:hypothetical protein